MFIVCLILSALGLIWFFVENCSAEEPKIFKCVASLIFLLAFIYTIVF